MKNWLRINENMYYFDSQEKGQGGRTTGTVYHLCQDNVDLAVKLYLNLDEVEDYPDLETITYFGVISSQVLPVVVSHSPVFDQEGAYIGCSAPFLYESKGNTSDLLCNLPKKEVFSYLHSLNQTIDIFTDLHIQLCDWAIYNLRFGENVSYQLPFSLYMIDDSFYEQCDDQTTKDLYLINRMEMNHLIASIADEFLSAREDILPKVEREYVKRYEHVSDSLRLLEKDCEPYATLGEFFSSVHQKGIQKQKRMS
ncbi:MAG TPA: hypothetical protein IAB56_04485 [Candidatus Scybalousia intestinigallinarum]|nr:hypothetical protein [Candidatus Scybalousia intestinigallinarum]